MLYTDIKWWLDNTFRLNVCFFSDVCRLYKRLPLCSPAEANRVSSPWREALMCKWILPCSAQSCSSRSISHPDSSLAAVPVWWAASAPCPYFSSRCPLCKGCAGEYILSQSPGSGISRSDLVSEPVAPLWRSSHSSPTPWPGKCFVGGGRACPTRARPARAAACLGWHRRDRNAQQPPPHVHPATSLEPWTCRENRLHRGASAEERCLRGEAEHCTEVRRKITQKTQATYKDAMR